MGQEIIKMIKECFFPTEIENVIVCEDILSDEICATLRKAAEKLKVGAKIVDQFIREAPAKVKISMAKVEKVIKEIVAKGITKIQEIIKKIKEYFFPTEIENVIVCEDILSDEICATLRKA